MGSLVSFHQGEARTTSIAIAEGTGTEHRAVIQLVRNYQPDFEEFGPCAFEMRMAIRPQGGGRNTQIALLNEPQATLLMTYMKNTPIVREFKKRLVKAFYEFRSEGMQAFRTLEERIARLEQIQVNSASVYKNPVTRTLHEQGSSLSKWSRDHGFHRVKVSQEIGGHRSYPEIKQALQAGGLLPQSLSVPNQIKLLEAENESLRYQQNYRPARQRTDGKDNFLYQRFMELFGTRMSVKKWAEMYKPPCSTETINAALYRDVALTGPMLAIIMSALQFTPEEIREKIKGKRRSEAVFMSL